MTDRKLDSLNPIPDEGHQSGGLPETLTEPEGVEGFAPGQILAERYRVQELLGRGGVGEVWRAFDLKLRVEVALKALRQDLITSEKLFLWGE